LSKLDVLILGKYLSALADIVQEKVKNILAELSFSPFEGCTTKSADAHIRFFEDILESYGK
ncbi:35197_t:CDS:2, partial [Gigaspora margarita]